jgi:hypothetical protein
MIRVLNSISCLFVNLLCAHSLIMLQEVLPHFERLNPQDKLMTFVCRRKDSKNVM